MIDERHFHLLVDLTGVVAPLLFGLFAVIYAKDWVKNTVIKSDIICGRFCYNCRERLVTEEEFYKQWPNFNNGLQLCTACKRDEKLGIVSYFNFINIYKVKRAIFTSKSFFKKIPFTNIDMCFFLLLTMSVFLDIGLGIFGIKNIPLDILYITMKLSFWVYFIYTHLIICKKNTNDNTTTT